MLGVIIFSTLVALLSFLEYRRRNGPWDSSLTRSFSLRSARTKPPRPKHDSTTAPLEHSSSANNDKCDNSLPRIETASRAHIKRVNFCEETPQVYKARSLRDLCRSKPTSSRVAECFPSLSFTGAQVRPDQASQPHLNGPFSIEQKALPDFCFGHPPHPMAIPSSASEVLTEFHPESTQERNFNFREPSPFRSSLWSSSFAARNDNAMEANKDARTPRSRDIHSAHNTKPHNDPRRVNRRDRRNKGPARTMRKAVARFGHQLAKLDHGGDDTAVDISPMPVSSLSPAALHSGTAPTAATLFPMEVEARDQPRSSLRKAKTTPCQQGKEKGSLRRSFNNLGEKFGVHKVAWTNPYSPHHGNTNGGYSPLYGDSRAPFPDHGFSTPPFESKSRTSLWKGSWSLGERKRGHDRPSLFDIQWERNGVRDVESVMGGRQVQADNFGGDCDAKRVRTE